MLRTKTWLLYVLGILMMTWIFTVTKCDVHAEDKDYEIGSFITTTEDTCLFNEATTNEGVKCDIPAKVMCTVLENAELFTKVSSDYGVGYLYEEYIGHDDEIIGAYEAELAAKSEEVRILAALIQCEAGGEDLDGMIAVGSVVMNRVKSLCYPNSIVDVINAPGQFPPARGEHMSNLLANDSIKQACRDAAREAFQGVDLVAGATHFKRAGSREGIVVGHHVFF